MTGTGIFRTMGSRSGKSRGIVLPPAKEGNLVATRALGLVLLLVRLGEVVETLEDQ